MIVMPHFRTKCDVERCGQQIIRNASQPMPISGQQISLTLSVGVSIHPDNGHSPEQLLRHVDAAMYAVKDTGRNNLCVYDKSLLPARQLIRGEHTPACERGMGAISSV